MGIIISVVAALWLLTACSADDATDQNAQEELRLEAWASTRTGGTTNYGNIMAFLSSTDGLESQGVFNYYHEIVDETEKHYWRSQNLKVKPGTRTFYLYGFMPAEYTGSMNKDAYELTIENLDPLSDKDICFVTGVALSNSELSEADMNAYHRGKYTFEYKNSDYQEATYLNLLLEPLFGRLEFKFMIGPEYYQLRRIKLKEVEIDAQAKERLDATVILPKGLYDEVLVDYTWTGSVTNNTKELWKESAGVALTNVASGPYGGINVAVGKGVDCNLICTYEVYDLNNNLLSVRKATNSLANVMPKMGQKRTVTLTIEPTYLYVLSDQDLDNPTVKIN